MIDWYMDMDWWVSNNLLNFNLKLIFLNFNLKSFSFVKYKTKQRFNLRISNKCELSAQLFLFTLAMIYDGITKGIGMTKDRNGKILKIILYEL